MQVVVSEHHNHGERRVFEGEETTVRDELLDAYPHLLVKFGPHASVEILVSSLDRTQAYTAVMTGGDVILKSESEAKSTVLFDTLGHHRRYESALAAARFMAGNVEPAMPVRQALIYADGDVQAAALMAFGLPVTPAYLEALVAVLAASGEALEKAEDTAPPLPTDVEPATPDGTEFAEGVKRSFEGKDAFHVKLGGKHSTGSILARDPQRHVTFLLKPGSGPQSPALGAREEDASQAKREAAAWAAAKVLGTDAYLSEAHLLLLDGKEFAAIHLLPWAYKSALRLQEEDPNSPRRLFGIFLPAGTLHRLAAFDFIIGQTDRHAGNVMVRGADFKLIDHGAAFAGPDFNPALDKMSFVPFYLRAMAPSTFPQMTPEEKLRALPRVSAGVEKCLRKWLGGIDTEALATELSRFGIDPAASIARVRILQGACAYTTADLAINGAWVLP